MRTCVLRVALIGLGRLGLSLALALQNIGTRVVGLFDVSPEARERAQALTGLGPSADLPSLLTSDPDLIFIAVPDAAVGQAAADLAAAWPTAMPGADMGAWRLAVTHTSGATSVSALGPCAALGAATFVFHPLQTFADPVSGASRFAGATIAVTPGPHGGEKLGEAIATALGAHPFLLPENRRGLYHAAACVASNYLVTLEYVAEQMFISAGLPQERALAAFLPLVRGAVDNVAALGAVAALTGPLARGDVGTIERHLTSIAESMPEVEALYRVLGLATLQLVRAQGTCDPAVLETLATLLSPSVGVSAMQPAGEGMDEAKPHPLLQSVVETRSPRE